MAALRVSSWCADYVANITIGWYADQFSQKDIPFSVTADIPEIREAFHADISSYGDLVSFESSDKYFKVFVAVLL